MKTPHSLKNLFVSASRAKLLNIFFNQPRQMFYVRELVRLSGEEINSIRRELANLKSGNIITSESRGNRLYYSVNPRSWLYVDLLVLTAKTSAFVTELKSQLVRAGSLDLMLYSYPFLNREEKSRSGIDIIIVGDLSPRILEPIIDKWQSEFGREINYMVMDRSQYALRRQKRDPLLVDFFLDAPSVIIGKPSDIYQIS
jgi:hypothetical protein